MKKPLFVRSRMKGISHVRFCKWRSGGRPLADQNYEQYSCTTLTLQLYNCSRKHVPQH